MLSREFRVKFLPRDATMRGGPRRAVHSDEAMTPRADRTLLLTERARRVCRLAPDDVAFLTAHHAAHFELLPTGRRDVYSLTPGGFVGVVTAPSCRLVVRPKIPLANLFFLLDPLLPC